MSAGGQGKPGLCIPLRQGPPGGRACVRSEVPKASAFMPWLPGQDWGSLPSVPTGPASAALNAPCLVVESGSGTCLCPKTVWPLTSLGLCTL